MTVICMSGISGGSAIDAGGLQFSAGISSCFVKSRWPSQVFKAPLIFIQSLLKSDEKMSRSDTSLRVLSDLGPAVGVKVRIVSEFANHFPSMSRVRFSRSHQSCPMIVRSQICLPLQVASSIATLNSFTAQEWSTCRVLRLSGLDLSGQWPACLTPAILAQLYQMELSGCGLSVLPASLQHATSLRVLDLQANKLERLPEWFQAELFPHLSYLSLARNKMISLSLAVGEFPLLRYLNAEFNAELTADQKVHADLEPSDPGALLRYMKDCATGETQAQRRFRLLLLGEPLVGKSALVECLQKLPGYWWFQKRLWHSRARTQFPLIVPYTLSKPGVDSADWLHALITDPPGECYIVC